MTAAADAFFAALPESLASDRSARVLAASLQRGRLAHALLLYGESLDALETVALALARALLGDLAKDGRHHPDLFALRPSKKARFIRIGESSAEFNTMRHLLHEIQQTPNQGARKVALVYEADRMNVQAANAFLKTLEEPPADTTLLLLTTRPHDLLPTIRSRCLRFRVSAESARIIDPEWLDWLDRYAKWLDELNSESPDATGRARLILGVYGLTARFQEVLGRLSAERWKAERKDLPDGLDDDEIAAHETGFRKTLRSRLFLDIERTTAAFGRECARKGPYPVAALRQTIHQLESAHGLTEVNLREEAAIEAFLLVSLRAWVRAGN